MLFAALVATTISVDSYAVHAQQTGNAPSRISAIQCGALARDADAPQLNWRGNVLQWTEWPVVLGARAVSARIVVVRFDPRAVRLSLDLARDGDAIGGWTLDRAPNDALLALNAGQFTDAGPWGWVVHRGREWQTPGAGALAGALVVDSTGTVSVIDANDIGARRRDTNARVSEALQSYPTLIGGNGAPPSLVCDVATRDALLDRTHRDARLAIGTLADGRVVVAMSRYAGVGALAERLPVGPTTPEMAEIMRRLGAIRALMLDGGLSAQMLVRETAGGVATQWPGLRGVPLALIGRIRQGDSAATRPTTEAGGAAGTHARRASFRSHDQQ